MQPYSVMRAEKVYFPYFAIRILGGKMQEELVWGIKIAKLYSIGDRHWNPAFH